MVAGTFGRCDNSSAILQSLGLAVELSNGSLQKGSSMLLQNQHFIPVETEKGADVLKPYPKQITSENGAYLTLLNLHMCTVLGSHFGIVCPGLDQIRLGLVRVGEFNIFIVKFGLPSFKNFAFPNKPPFLLGAMGSRQNYLPVFFSGYLTYLLFSYLG